MCLNIVLAYMRHSMLNYEKYKSTDNCNTRLYKSKHHQLSLWMVRLLKPFLPFWLELTSLGNGKTGGWLSHRWDMTSWEMTRRDMTWWWHTYQAQSSTSWVVDGKLSLDLNSCEQTNMTDINIFMNTTGASLHYHQPLYHHRKTLCNGPILQVKNMSPISYLYTYNII